MRGFLDIALRTDAQTRIHKAPLAIAERPKNGGGPTKISGAECAVEGHKNILISQKNTIAPPSHIVNKHSFTDKLKVPTTVAGPKNC